MPRDHEDQDVLLDVARGQAKKTLAERLQEEKETQEERLAYLHQEVERLFSGEDLAPLRSSIERSFCVPQYGAYHNEGAFMDRHVHLALATLDDIKKGVFPAELPQAIRSIIGAVTAQHEEVLRRYVLLHDIAKFDCLRLCFEDGRPDQTLRGRNGRPWR